MLGNHDLHLVMVAEGYGKKHKEDTLDAILEAPDRDELLAWLRAQPLLHVEDGYAVVHAGLLPQWSVAQAQDSAREVAQALSAPNYRDFLRHLYGSEPNGWRDDLEGWDRLRVIVNAMTRMRFCTPEGSMEFRHKGPLGSAPPGYLPWFAVPGRASCEPYADRRSLVRAGFEDGGKAAGAGYRLFVGRRDDGGAVWKIGACFR